MTSTTTSVTPTAGGRPRPAARRRRMAGRGRRSFMAVFLGLPLAIGLTELHGGTLSIESERGNHTTVWVKLPRSLPLPLAEAAIAAT